MAEAQAVGSAWAHELRGSLKRENRRASGGWPGTVSEARARARILLLPWLSTRGAVLATQEQVASLTSALYASARATWRDHCEPEEHIENVES
jgi:hypothetical protein